ncbi:phage terminase small subunit [Streptomyces roseolus]|uniref:phage terminase small subunit n=1 Tax=Streptomyces roseolus TaxID=67358 RepID=UPI003689698B
MGPPPSENRRRRNKDEAAEFGASVQVDTELHGPELPHALLYGPRTLNWYETWRRAPQAGAFVPTDWQRLHMLAPLVDLFFLEPSVKLLSEIRLNESLLGATHADRLRARIKIEPQTSRPGAAQGVTSLETRRRRKIADGA